MQGLLLGHSDDLHSLREQGVELLEEDPDRHFHHLLPRLEGFSLQNCLNEIQNFFEGLGIETPRGGEGLEHFPLAFKKL